MYMSKYFQDNIKFSVSHGLIQLQPHFIIKLVVQHPEPHPGLDGYPHLREPHH
jgi:hypothetical protein